MAYKLVRREAAILTPEAAKAAKDAKSIPGERALKKSRMNFIIGLLDAGTFCRADFAFAKCKEDDNVYRVNGQHTSRVLVECNDNEEMPEFPVNVPLVTEFWECDSISELLGVFSSYDSTVSGRSASDYLGVHKANHIEELDGVSPEAIKWGLEGINFCKRMAKNSDDPHFSAKELGHLLDEEGTTNFCGFIQELKDASFLGIKDKGICAAIYRSWLEDPEKADSVWGFTFDESDEDPNSNSRKYVNSMRTARSKGRKAKSFDWFYNQTKRYWARSRKETLSS